jgi:hypothetical protein
MLDKLRPACYSSEIAVRKEGGAIGPKALTAPNQDKKIV